MDEQIWFYIIAALIYFFTRKKKKPQPKPSQQSRQTSEQKPQQKPVSFEELLREITEGRVEEEPEKTIEVEEEPEEIVSEREEFKKEGRTRSFADDESRRIYEESIKRAEEIDHEFKPSEHYHTGSLVRKKDEVEETSLADEIREDLKSPDSARKAIIYSEILTRKY